MVDLLRDLAVQTSCFRSIRDAREVAACVRECGLGQVELSGAHVEFRDGAACDRALEAFCSAGIGVVGVGVVGLWHNVDQGIPAFEFATRAGVKCVGVDFTPDALWDGIRRAEKLAEKYDLRLAIHNHGGRHWLGNTLMLRHLFANTGERIGLQMDTAWTLDAGEDPVKWVREFRHRLYSVHLKDFVFNRARKTEDVIVGTGNVDLPALFGALHEAEFGGSIVLEYEGDVDNPLPSVAACAAAIKEVWAGLGSAA